MRRLLSLSIVVSVAVAAIATIVSVRPGSAESQLPVRAHIPVIACDSCQPPPTPTPPSVVAFSDGTYFIGEDIPAGTYRLRSAPSGCYWERLSGLSGGLGDIIANSFGSTTQIVTIAPGDVAFHTDDCGTWTSDLSPVTASPTTPFGDGMYFVTEDVAAGTWYAPGGSSCYWARLSGFSGKLADIITNDFGNTSVVVEISASDAGFESSRCGTWSRNPAPAPGGTFGDGTYLVGAQVTPGTYRTRTPADGCYWERLSGLSGELGHIIANSFSDYVQVVTIAPGDVAFHTDGCGTWTTDLSSITAGTTSPFGDGIFIVGTDIAAGTWHAPGGGSCYWARLSGFSAELDDITDNDFGETSPSVAISGSDKGFQSSNCGTWVKS